MSSHPLFSLFVCLLVGAALPASEPLPLSEAEHAWVAAHPVVCIQMGDNSPPFELRRDGQWQGLSYDMLLAACRRIGLRVEVQDVSWNTALAGIATGTSVDLILAVTRSPERERQMLLTAGYLDFPQVIVADRRRMFVSAIADLRGSTVAVERNYVMESWLRRDLPSAHFFTPPDTLPALQAVSDGRADAYVGNLAVATWLIDHHGLINLGVAAPSCYGDEVFAMGVRKDWPELVALLDRAFMTMPDAERQAIRQRWLAVRYDFGLRYQDIALWVLAVSAIAALFVVQLRRMVATRTRELAGEVTLRRERESQLAEAQRIAHLGSWSQTLGDNTIEHSAEVSTILGTPPDHRLTTEGYLAAVHPEDRERVIVAHRTEAAGETPGELDYRIIRPSGEVRHVLRRSTVVRAANGCAVRVQGVILDITERTALEERLRQALRLQSLGQLAGCVAHDFNNVLTGIGGYAELLGTRTQDVQAKDYAARICGVVERAHTQTARLLAFARQGASTPVAFDAHVAIAAALDLFQAARPGLVEVNRSLTATATGLRGYRGQFESAILNLCMNARDAMPQGGRLTISTTNEDVDDPDRLAPNTVSRGPFLRIEVVDQGQGMDSVVLTRCLEPLFTTKGERGTGLGLSTVQACAIDHHGALRLDSVPGRGTTITLWLPLDVGLAG